MRVLYQGSYSVTLQQFLFNPAEESVFSVPGVKLWPEERRYPNSMLKMGSGGGGGSGAFGAAGSSSGSGRQSVSIAASD